ncbi:MAG: hypothetical protein GY789_19890 [Hyphomicrobiales bacterium]|nr:hypothetical protein [Hyphomicrobiales bacterium]MCP4999779.1 hypothetical protein [Hyphomicrobiales bacterium]
MCLLRLAVIVLAIPVLCVHVFAQAEPLYQGPVPVRLNGKVITIPVALYAETAGDNAESILLHAYARTQDLAPIMRDQLQFLADEKISACELRINVPETNVGVAGSTLVITALVSAEVWVCTILKTRLGGEDARIVAGAQPTVRNGRLFLEPGSLQIDGIGDLVTSIGGDRVLQDLYYQAIERFNRDRRLTSLPRKLANAGFAYQAAEVGTFNGTPSMLRISIIGPNDLVNLVKILAGIR